MTTYLPALNGIYGMNGNFMNQKLNYSQNFVDNANPHMNNNNKNEAKEIIHCINENFENLLLLITGTNNLYRKEMEKNNKNMVNIDDNMDSLFYSLKNLNENINDLNVRMKNIESNYQENVTEKIKDYTGEHVNSLRLDLALIYSDILKLFDESTKQKEQKHVVLDVQYDVHSVSFEGDTAQEVQLNIDFEVINYNYSNVDVKDRNKIELEYDENIIDIKYPTIKSKKRKRKKKINNKNNQNKENIKNVKQRTKESLNISVSQYKKKEKNTQENIFENICWKYPNCHFGDNCKFYHPNTTVVEPTTSFVLTRGRETTHKRENHRKYNIYYHGDIPSKSKIYYDGNCSLCGRYSHTSENCVGYDLIESCNYCNDEHTYLFQCIEKKKVFSY